MELTQRNELIANGCISVHNHLVCLCVPKHNTVLGSVRFCECVDNGVGKIAPLKIEQTRVIVTANERLIETFGIEVKKTWYLIISNEFD